MTKYRVKNGNDGVSLTISSGRPSETLLIPEDGLVLDDVPEWLRFWEGVGTVKIEELDDE